MRILTLLVYLVLALIGISFAALNAATVTVHFYLTQWTAPVAVFLIGAFILGFCLSGFFFLAKYWRLKMACTRLKTQLQLTEKEVRNLRDIPLKDAH